MTSGLYLSEDEKNILLRFFQQYFKESDAEPMFHHDEDGEMFTDILVKLGVSGMIQKDGSVS